MSTRRAPRPVIPNLVGRALVGGEEGRAPPTSGGANDGSVEIVWTVTALPPDSNDSPPFETWASMYEVRVFGQ